jgi:hypothetical protein
MPGAQAAPKSIDAFRGPVDAISFSAGRRSITSAVNDVHFRTMQTTSNGVSRDTSASTAEI